MLAYLFSNLKSYPYLYDMIYISFTTLDVNMLMVSMHDRGLALDSIHARKGLGASL